MKNPTIPLALLATITVFSSCGGSDSKDGGSSPDSASKGPTTLTAEKAPVPSNGASAPTVSPLSIEEEKNRRLVMQTAKDLAACKDSLDRAEILSRIRKYGSAAKPLWDKVLVSLKDEEPITRGSALEALAAIDFTMARPYVETGMRDDEAEVRQKAYDAWGTARVKDLGPVFKAAIEETSAKVQQSIMKLILEQGGPANGPDVARLLSNMDPLAAKLAVQFIVKNKLADLGPKLIELLNWKDPELRAQAADALGTLAIKSKAVYEALARNLMDEMLEVRKSAHIALKSLTGQELDYNPAGQSDVLLEGQTAWKEWISTQK